MISMDDVVDKGQRHDFRRALLPQLLLYQFLSHMSGSEPPTEPPPLFHLSGHSDEMLLALLSATVDLQNVLKDEVSLR